MPAASALLIIRRLWSHGRHAGTCLGQHAKKKGMRLASPRAILRYGRRVSSSGLFACHSVASSPGSWARPAFPGHNHWDAGYLAGRFLGYSRGFPLGRRFPSSPQPDLLDGEERTRLLASAATAASRARCSASHVATFFFPVDSLRELASRRVNGAHRRDKPGRLFPEWLRARYGAAADGHQGSNLLVLRLPVAMQSASSRNSTRFLNGEGFF